MGNLSATTVICTDKTSTLTKNEMAVRYLWLLTRTSHIIRKLNVSVKNGIFVNNIMLISLVHVGFLVTVPFAANALTSQPVSQNFEGEINVPISQGRPSYQRGYTVHYRSPRDRQWTLEGFHAERPDAERAARRLERNGFRTQIRSRAAAERRSNGGR